MILNATTDLPDLQNSTFDWGPFSSVPQNSTEFDWEPYSYYNSPGREIQLLWLTICITLGTCGNIAVLATISSVEELRTPGNTLLCTLAVADILQIITKGPFCIWLLVQRQALQCSNSLFQGLTTGYLVGSVFSVNIIGPISLDRYCYICFPLQYRTIMTKPRTAALIGVTLVVTLTIVLVPFFAEGWEEWGFYFFPPFVSCKYIGPSKKIRQASMNASYAVTVLLMIFCYLKIWREVRRQQNRHRHLLPQTLSAPVDSAYASGQKEHSGSGTTQQTGLTRSPSVAESLHSHKESPQQPEGFRPEVVSISSLSPRSCESVMDKHKRVFTTSNKVAPQTLEHPRVAQTARQLIHAEFKQRMKTATTVLIVIGVYFLTWLPYFVIISRLSKWGDEVAAMSDGPFQRFAMLFSLISTFANPFIYTRNRPFRQGFLRLFRLKN